MKRFACLGLLMMAMAIIGCGGKNAAQNDPVDSGKRNATLPAFSLSVSEYPSWSTYMTAGKVGLINPEQGGKHGELEAKYGVDVVLNVVDYDKCIELFGSGASDAVCITNMDVLPIAVSRKSTAICPTSTSVGADQCIVNGVNDIDDLKNHQIHLLTKSVSEYTVFRCLEKQGKNFRDYKVKHYAPEAAATALESNSPDVKAICVWNPFALNVTKKNKDAKILFSTDTIPEEVVDMVVVANEVLQKDRGKEFAKCLCDVFYRVNQRLENSDTADETLQMLGEDFSDLPVDDMRLVVKETRFYKTPEAGTALFASDKFKDTMKTVIRVCQEIEVLGKEADSLAIGYNTASSDEYNLTFDPQYMSAK